MHLLIPVILVAAILGALVWHLYREHARQKRNTPPPSPLISSQPPRAPTPIKPNPVDAPPVTSADRRP